jgi:hypothetical protein
MGIYYSSPSRTLCIPCPQILRRRLWALEPTPKAAIGVLLNLRNGQELGFLMSSALQSLAFVKLLALALAGLIHGKSVVTHA